MARPKNDIQRKTTSLKINPVIWQQFKVLAVTNGFELSEKIEQLLQKEIERENKKTSANEGKNKVV